MSHHQNISPASSKTTGSKKLKTNKTASRKQKRPRVNWHEAASCALQIELRDYSDLLEYLPEYILGKNSYRIDLLVIKKLTGQPIPKSIAHIFKTFNLFEIKGLGSSVSIDSYYKTIGYAGLLIAQSGSKNQYSRKDISLTFLSYHYPQRLMKHLLSLQKEMNLTVENSSKGVYYINKETFTTQIIVTSKLPPEEYLYLRCLTDKLQDTKLVNQLTDDYKLHQEQDIYIRYMHQLTTANKKTKGDVLMVCEGLLNLFGTSSEEIIERTRKEDAEYYLPKIDSLSSQIDYLKSLLKQNNIPFNQDIISND
ncbi:MAG: hypothetical protein HDR71_20125 [Lachnospiraceae bacterium]|nr:hypothetical protein [Lachnospiraceae bacterium]